MSSLPSLEGTRDNPDQKPVLFVHPMTADIDSSNLGWSSPLASGSCHSTDSFTFNFYPESHEAAPAYMFTTFQCLKLISLAVERVSITPFLLNLLKNDDIPTHSEVLTHDTFTSLSPAKTALLSMSCHYVALVGLISLSFTLTSNSQ